MMGSMKGGKTKMATIGKGFPLPHVKASPTSLKGKKGYGLFKHKRMRA